MKSVFHTEQSVADRALYKHMLTFLMCTLFLLSSLYIFVIAPLYVWVTSDVLYISTFYPDILETLISVTNILLFSAFYGIFLYAVYRFPISKARTFLYIYIGSILYKNIGNLLMSYITDGIPVNDIFSDLLYVGLYILLELLQTAIAVSVGGTILIRAKKREQIRMEAAVAAKKVYKPISEYLPFSRLFNMKNPLQKSAFWMAFVPMFMQILQRIYYDIFIFITAEGFYGDPLVDILWMILYYTFDFFAFGVVVYFIIIFLLSHFDVVSKKKEENTKDDTDLLLGK